MTDPNESHTATRGLATVALLKVNFDAGHDHIAMFEPFIVDALSHTDAEAFTTEEFRDLIADRHQLSLPVNTLRTLLGRSVRKSYLRREAGRYFRTERVPPSTDIDAQRARVEREQQNLAQALVEYCATHGVEVQSLDDGLGLILSFLDRYHVTLALESAGSGRGDDGAALENDSADRPTLLTAGFLRSTALAESALTQVLQEMLEGYILQNALFLKDISTANRRFRHLRVYFDSGLLFSILGYRGAPTEVATRELLHLLSDSGAFLEVFDITLQEMRRILAVYEDRIGSHSGRLSLYQTDMTRHFLTNHYTASDIRTEVALLERNLRGLGFNIREVPPHEIHLTLDESALASRLAERPGAENVPRVVHDVDCVAAILTLRRGRYSESWDDAGAVFVTTSGLTVRNTVEWYQAEGEHGVPPIIHHLALSNLAWLKRPASATKLKLHELVALCTAALRPSRRAWQAFVNHLRKLEESGDLSSDEVTALVATSLADKVLAEEAIDEDSDAQTLTEVVERVKTTYQAAADARVDDATAEATQAKAEASRLRMTTERRARTVGRISSWLTAGVLGLCLALGTVLTVGSTVSGSPPSPLAATLTLVPLAITALLSLMWGFNIRDWRRRVEDRVARRVAHWLMGGE